MARKSKSVYRPSRFKTKLALKMLAKKGIEDGDTVTFSWRWTHPDLDLPIVSSHTGPIRIDAETGFFEIKPSNNPPGHYRSHLETFYADPEKATVVKETTIKKAKPNPFLQKKQKPNPFLKGKR